MEITANHVHFFISGGAPCPPSLMEKWRDAKGVIFRQGYGLTEASPATQLADGYLEEGVALQITQARLMIERKQHTQPVEPEDEAVVFTIDLNAGQTLLHTWFDDDRKQPSCGAYYVYVSRLD